MFIRKRKKRWLSLFLAVVCLCVMSGPAAAAQPNPGQEDVTIVFKFNSGYACRNSIPYDLEGKQIYLHSTGTTMVPLRVIGETLGYTVTFTDLGEPIRIVDPSSGKKSEFLIGSSQLKIYPDSSSAAFETITMPAAPELRGTSVYVPLRSIAEPMDAQVEYREVDSWHTYVLIHRLNHQAALSAQEIGEKLQEAKLGFWTVEPDTQSFMVDYGTHPGADTDTYGDYLGQIPVMEVFIKDGTRKPLMIIQHGLGMSKEDMFLKMYRFAQSGYHVIGIDAYGHGQRQNQKEIPIFHVEIRTSEDLETVIQYYQNGGYDFNDTLETHGKVNAWSYGLCGFSMGGMTTLYQSAHGKIQPKAAVSFCASPAWKSLLYYDDSTNGSGHYTHRILCPMSPDPSTGTSKMLPNTPAAIRMEKALIQTTFDIEKQSEIFELARTPLYLMCGAADTVVPPAGAQAFYQEIEQNAWRYPGADIRCKTYADAGHYVTMDMMDDAVAFFAEYFFPTGA